MINGLLRIWGWFVLAVCLVTGVGLVVLGLIIAFIPMIICLLIVGFIMSGMWALAEWDQRTITKRLEDD